MKTFHFIILSFLIGIYSCGISHRNDAGKTTGSNNEQAYPAGNYPDRIMQSVSEKPAEQITVSWRTSTSIKSGFVEFAPFSPKNNVDNSQIVEAEKVHINFENVVNDHYFQATINQLVPNKEYSIRVGNKNYRSEWFKVRTAPEAFEPFSFLWFGDVQNDIKEFAPRIFSQAMKKAPDAKFIVHSGDLVLSSGNDDTWGEWFYSGSWMFREIPSLAIPGNSDHFRMTEDPIDQRILFPQWHGVFRFPRNGPENMDNVAYYYDYPGIRMVALYSNFESTTKDDREIFLNPEIQLTDKMFYEQTQWLEQVLRTNTQKWLMVVMHHPVFTAREERYNELLLENWLPLFEKHKVDFVLQGHDHVYARGFNPNSSNQNKLPVYAISFAGGKSRTLDNSHKWIKASLEDTQLFQVIQVNDTEIEYKAYDAGGRIIDSFAIIENQNGKSIIE